jgi:hypothetical protein
MASSNETDLIAAMLKLVYAFLGRNESAAFCEPVDWKTLGLVDYPTLVKKPMDLGTIRDKIILSGYTSADDIAGDIRLVWTNCMTYNQDGSEYYQLAEIFARKFEEKYGLLRRQFMSTDLAHDDAEKVPSLEERIQMSYDLFKLEPVQLARALTVVELWSPNAISKKPSEDDVYVNIDTMSPRCFSEVASFIRSCKPDSKGKKKKAASAGGGSSAAATGNAKKKQRNE